MQLNDEQNKYVAYMKEKILPALKASTDDKLQNPTANLEWNLKKLLGEAKEDGYTIETYVKRTKSDFKVVAEVIKDGDPIDTFAKDVMSKIDGFFGVQVEAVDMKPILSAKAKESKEKDLDWNKSIVDLIKLLGMDSSLAARKKLAETLGFPEAQLDKQAGSAEFNMWLHRSLINSMAYNGGELPPNIAHLA